MPMPQQPAFRNVGTKVTLIDAATATGVFTVADISQFQNAEFILSGSSIGTATAVCVATVKVRASNNRSGTVTLSSPATAANPWSYAQILNMNDFIPINGSDGISITTNGVSHFKVNGNAYKIMALEISSITSGQVDAAMTPVNNE